MQKLTFGLTLILLAGGLTACSSDLVVYTDGNPGQEKVAGVPLPMPETYIEEGWLLRHGEEGPNCTATPYQETVAIAGTVYYVDLIPGELADTEFSVELHEKGFAKNVSLGSKSRGPDTIKALGETFALVAPSVPSIIPRATDPQERVQDDKEGKAENGKRPLCNAGKSPQSFVPLRCWDPGIWVPLQGVGTEAVANATKNKCVAKKVEAPAGNGNTGQSGDGGNSTTQGSPAS